jgi:hypothetical protein
VPRSIRKSIILKDLDWSKSFETLAEETGSSVQYLKDAASHHGYRITPTSRMLNRLGEEEFQAMLKRFQATNPVLAEEWLDLRKRRI